MASKRKGRLFKSHHLSSLTVLELATPPLDGIILPGVVRQSLLDLARTWVGYLEPHSV